MLKQEVAAERTRIEFLDYMRIFAFSSVLLGHKFMPWLSSVAVDLETHVTMKLFFEALMALSFGGAAGVVVFFFTSGYIITHVLRGEGTLEFAIKRIFRIYPLYMFAVILEVVLNHFVFYIPAPPMSVIVQRLLLVGDLFDTPYGLASVEWTLRIEVTFYVLMMMIKSLGLIDKPRLLPLVFSAATVALYFSDPFPKYAGWTDGYFNIFMPMLFVGSIIYLFEKKLSSSVFCISSVLIIFILSLSYIGAEKPELRDSNFMILAFGLFVASWALRKRIVGGRLVKTLSEITFGVYLFHNWLWLYLETWIPILGVDYLPLQLQVVIVLFLFCYLVHRSVEVYGIKAGRFVIGHLKSRYLAYA